MFGYTSEELLESNANIKCLMPKRQADKHDTYLLNYLSTGVKKVIGSGQQVVGLRKDGTEFPIHLSISEVVEDGFHLFTAIVRDLTEITEEENYKQSTETQMMWKIEKSGRVMSLNQRFKQYVGITTREQEKVADVWDAAVVHPEEYQYGKALFAKANTTMKPFELKRRLKSKEGTYRWFLTKGIPVYNTRGEFKFWCGACTDIDDAITLESEMKTLQNSLPILLWKTHADGTIFYVNSNFARYVGTDFENTSQKLASNEICFSEDAKLLTATMETALKKKAPFELKIRMKGRAGAFKWFTIAASPILNGDGVVSSFYGVCIDIDASERASKELEIIPENLTMMIWKADRTGNVLYANTNFYKYVGAKQGDALNVFASSVVHAEDFKQSQDTFAKGNKDMTPFSIKRRLKAKDGSYSAFITKGIPVIDEASGTVTCWYGTCSSVEN
ncbi:hypothetical protein HDV03_004882 [Kappamyces sp. JEL0829]|nr:hypothetical protein HDV03_004882 [Kappamyces sp. JEL0829]